ncbi:hypothetical protein AMECASPLE_030941 [Ameca splendens]|uniref:Uncharacterized protein n=1 Tax=Ameca splendens TaxID=208324 RepID=A0ABV0Z4F9_9TELE
MHRFHCSPNTCSSPAISNTTTVTSINHHAHADTISHLPLPSLPTHPLHRDPCLPWLYSWLTGTTLLDGRGNKQAKQDTRKQNYMMNFARQTGMRHYYSRKRRALQQRA